MDENEVTRLVEGQRARIRTEAYANRVFAAGITKIAPMGQGVQNVTYFKVELEINDPDAHLLRPRMSGDAEIITKGVEDAIVIPETALRSSGDRIFVNTVASGETPRIVERTVALGIVDNTRVQILSGLEPSEGVQLQ